MVILLSPSKTMREEKIEHPEPTSPVFPEMTSKVIRKLRGLTKKDLKKQMGISDKLTDLNYTRFKNFDLNFGPLSGQAAIFSYEGDVYAGLESPSWSQEDLKYAENRLLILSGLYGVLHPSTLVQPYRLEMGGKAKIGRNSLYKFWSQEVTAYVNQVILDQDGGIVLNLASQEYSEVLNRNQINARFIDIQFREWRDEQWKFISYNAKKARGIMARFVIQNRIETPVALQSFDLDDYKYNPELSSDNELFFTK